MFQLLPASNCCQTTTNLPLRRWRATLGIFLSMALPVSTWKALVMTPPAAVKHRAMIRQRWPTAIVDSCQATVKLPPEEQEMAGKSWCRLEPVLTKKFVPMAPGTLEKICPMTCGVPRRMSLQA